MFCKGPTLRKVLATFLPQNHPALGFGTGAESRRPAGLAVVRGLDFSLSDEGYPVIEALWQLDHTRIIIRL